MAVTIVAWSVISALGGLVPTSAFVLLLAIRGSLGLGQAITDPSGSGVIADFYGMDSSTSRRCPTRWSASRRWASS